MTTRTALAATAAAMLAVLVSVVSPTTAGADDVNLAVAGSVPIPDGGTGSVGLDVDVDGYVASVSAGVRIAHPATSQLEVVLVGPGGERSVLVRGQPSGGGGAAGFGSGDGCTSSLTTFSDSATAGIGSASNPYVGTFRPATPMAVFTNTDPDGQWRIEVTDRTAGSTGTIECARLRITTVAGLAVTTTADVVDAGDGLVSLREAMLESRANGNAPDLVVLARNARYAPRCTPTSGAGSVFETGPDDRVTIAGRGSRIASTCGLNLFGSVAGPSRLSLDRVELVAGGPSGPAVRATTVDATDVGIRGPFDDGVDADIVTATRLSVEGAADFGVRARATATLTDTSLLDNRVGLRTDGAAIVVGGTIRGNTVGVSATGTAAGSPVSLDGVTVRDNDDLGIQGRRLAVTASSVTGSAIGIRVPTSDPAAALALSDSTVASNGSGLDVQAGGALELTESTVARNTAVDVGGAPASFRTTRSAIGRCGPSVTASGGYNAAADTSCGLDGPGDRVGPLQLGPLEFSSPGAVVPLAGSPLIDAVPRGSCPRGDDQRGVSRPQGRACDIGSVEVRPVSPRSDSLVTSVSTTTVFDVTRNDVDPDGQLVGARVRVRDVAGAGSVSVRGRSLRFVAPETAGVTAVIYEVCSLGGTVCRSATATIRIIDPPGYWLLERDGGITAFGNAADLGGVTDRLGGAAAVAISARPQGDGYWVLADDGRLHAVGAAADLGGVDLAALTQPGEVVASLSATPTGDGVWVFTTAGRVLAFGDATPGGSMAGTREVLALALDGPVVDSVATPSGAGAYMVAADGGVFAVGDAEFIDSVRGALTDLYGPPGLPDLPVVGVVSDPDGRGYWMVASDGGVFSFAAPFRGSLPAIVPFEQLVEPVNGMVPYGDGYLLVASDGGVFNFSGLRFDGSGAGLLESPVVGIAAPAVPDD